MSVLRRLLGDRHGTIAVEGAMILPVLITMLLGTVEACNAIRAQAKVNIAAGMLADLVAGRQSVTSPGGTVADACTGAAMGLAPYKTASFSADIASVTNDHPSNRGNPQNSTSVYTYLDWEAVTACPTQATAMGLSGAFALADSPTSLLTKSGVSAGSPTAGTQQYGYSAIVVSVSYQYSNILTFLLGKTLTFTATAVAKPRSNTTVSCTSTNGTTPCPATS